LAVTINRNCGAQQEISSKVSKEIVPFQQEFQFVSVM